MKLTPLSLTERAAGGFTHRASLTHADLTELATNTAQVIDLLAVTAGQMIARVAAYLKTPFAAAGDAAFNSNTISIGDAGSATRFVAAFQANINGTEVLFNSGGNGGSATAIAALSLASETSTNGTFGAAADLAAVKVEGEKVGDDVRDVRAKFTSLLAEAAKQPYVYTAGGTIKATVNSMNAKALNVLDTGELIILLEVIDLTKLG